MDTRKEQQGINSSKDDLIDEIVDNEHDEDELNLGLLLGPFFLASSIINLILRVYFVKFIISSTFFDFLNIPYDFLALKGLNGFDFVLYADFG